MSNWLLPSGLALTLKYLPNTAKVRVWGLLGGRRICFSVAHSSVYVVWECESTTIWFQGDWVDRSMQWVVTLGNPHFHEPNELRQIWITRQCQRLTDRAVAGFLLFRAAALSLSLGKFGRAFFLENGRYAVHVWMRKYSHHVPLKCNLSFALDTHRKKRTTGDGEKRTARDRPIIQFKVVKMEGRLFSAFLWSGQKVTFVGI